MSGRVAGVGVVSAVDAVLCVCVCERERAREEK